MPGQFASLAYTTTGISSFDELTSLAMNSTGRGKTNLLSLSAGVYSPPPTSLAYHQLIHDASMTTATTTAPTSLLFRPDCPPPLSTPYTMNQLASPSSCFLPAEAFGSTPIRDSNMISSENIFGAGQQPHAQPPTPTSLLLSNSTDSGATGLGDSPVSLTLPGPTVRPSMVEISFSKTSGPQENVLAEQMSKIPKGYQPQHRAWQRPISALVEVPLPMFPAYFDSVDNESLADKIYLSTGARVQLAPQMSESSTKLSGSPSNGRVYLLVTGDSYAVSQAISIIEQHKSSSFSSGASLTPLPLILPLVSGTSLIPGSSALGHILPGPPASPELLCLRSSTAFQSPPSQPAMPVLPVAVSLHSSTEIANSSGTSFLSDAPLRHGAIMLPDLRPQISGTPVYYSSSLHPSSLLVSASASCSSALSSPEGITERALSAEAVRSVSGPLVGADCAPGGLVSTWRAAQIPDCFPAPVEKNSSVKMFKNKQSPPLSPPLSLRSLLPSRPLHSGRMLS
ncbi:unnamed protein product [Protopolystoma xenopodis]|uniref:Uncharacterized protein n=1 Tax=Protopolystoma xenopodis TaxID=117903 RepID=A0A448XFC6_9PLAT|nr:unnamed protein product [Protopolystoma xenopodis]